ncbi:hypothetical protein DL767_004685 [Monosporascus sp. MG133]|nr:hypothetical protein DL767_004685 [Monosporascus sp. MG133]
MGAPSELIETWCLYGVGSLIIFARIVCRWRLIGPQGLKPDDYIIFFSWVTYTVMTVAAHIVGGLGDLHALPLEARKAICQPQSTVNMVPPLVMNVVTDLLIMAFPAPILIKVNTTIWKRIGLLALFGGGFFIMVAAILRVTMVLLLKNGPVAAIWSCREDFVAIVVGQAILVRPMFTKTFWTGKYSAGQGNSSRPSKNSGNIGVSFEMSAKRSRKSKTRDPFSVTAALATVLGGMESGTLDIVGEWSF